MDFLAPYHPLIVHTPVALIIVSVLFEIAGLATDSAWMRKTSNALLVLGVLGGIVAILSGEPASEIAEKRQGIPESRIDWHGDAGKIATWLGGGAIVARVAAATIPGGRAAIAVVAFLLQLCSAMAVGVAGYRGGQLVFTHGAGVHVDGALVRSAHAEAESEPDSSAH